MLTLSPSILSGDFSRLGEEIALVEQAGATMLHIDVMDGQFVPSISYGTPVIESIRKVSSMLFDVHVMTERPERFIEEFIQAGADIITVHVEACPHLDGTIQKIKSLGSQAGVVLNPSTSLHTLEYVLDKVDMVLIMAVNPGFGGQVYIPETTQKIRELRRMIDSRNLKTAIQVDGGISLSNVREVIEAGADIIVAGSAVFEGNISQNVSDFLELFREYDNKQ